jgi:hypothetical protein
MRRVLAGLLCGILFAGASLSGAAQTRTDGSVPEQANRPGVARISVIDGGSVVVQRGESHKQVEGAVNAPLLPGDFITTGPGTHAEMQFDGFTMLRLSQNVQLRIVSSDARLHHIQIAAGTAELSVLREEAVTTTIDTPSVTVTAAKPSDVRVWVDAAGTTQVTARTGSATLQTPLQNYALESGTTYVASGNASKPAISLMKEVGYDAFDDFNAGRDKMLTEALANDANVPSSIAGYDNLNQYGRWVDVQPYGKVWIPNGVGSNWVPYRDGQWTWTGSYGWTWVANEPWGWVPYHYGRWFYQDGYGWCWDPPELADVPVWEPALVGFFGFGYDSLLSYSFGYSALGWVPLAPNENFYPWYGYNQWNGYNPGWPGYGGGGNSGGPRPTPRPVGTNPIRKPVPLRHIPGNPFRNAEFGAASGVDAQSFHEGDFAHVRSIDMSTLENLSVLRTALPLSPSSRNLAFSRAPVGAPITLSHVFTEPRFEEPVARAQQPAGGWNRSYPGYPTYQGHGPAGQPYYPGRGQPYPVRGQTGHSAPPSHASPPSHSAPPPPHQSSGSGSRPPHR